jgi:hypothetical protein
MLCAQPMKMAVLAVPIVASFAFTGEAGAGVPSFCAAIRDARVDATGDVKHIAADEEPRNALRDIVGRMCKPDSDAEDHMDELEAARKKWTARLELTEADWADVAVYATLGQGERMSGSIRLADDSDATRKKPWSSFDPIDQYVWITTPMGASGALSLDTNYLVDAFGSRLSEIGRLAYVGRCIRSKMPVEWAMCQEDIDKLDFKKIGDELHANQKYGGHDKVRIRILAADLKSELATHADRVKKLMASDPGYAKVFEAAAAARKEWDQRAKTAGALLDLALLMDDGRASNSRKAFDGCEDKTWAAFKSAVATVPAKTFEGMHDDRKDGKRFLDVAMTPIIGNPDAYLASIAFVTCMTVGQERGAKHDVLVRLLGEALAYWPGYRGPRTAAETAILAAGIALDDRDAKLEFPHDQRPFGGDGGSTSGGGAGVVASLKPAGKTTTVGFKPQMVRQVQCAEARETHKVIQIRPDGQLVYETICVRNETVTVNKASDPQTVNPRYLEGVKPGMYVSITEDVVSAAWAAPGAATPTMVFGVPLK